ncbi:ApeA N-terminal domain 1-containing protein [Actinoplanes derwentensis]|uniref:ApeA N-terminal domain 1-containing protein n=1 Tax=Actinoplanes derwentensis TaxID=113562 RepID=UPI0012FE42C8|nr:HEPN domain-containing protein [Actinoplanes derwentensis]
MRNVGEATFMGQWWLPGQNKRRSPGTLIMGDHSPELSLSSLSDMSINHIDDTTWPDIPIMHGASMGNCLTLLDVLTTKVSSSLGSRSEETRSTFNVGTALVGQSHLNSTEECRFNHASIQLPNFNEWVNRSPYRWTFSNSTTAVELAPLPPLRADVDGCKITAWRSTTSKIGRLSSAGFTSYEVIELRLDERLPLEEIEYRYIRPLEQLISLATGTSCQAFNIEVGIYDDPEGNTAEPSISSYAVRRTKTDMEMQEDAKIRQHMRFGMNCKEFPPNIEFPELVPKWFSLQAKISTVCDLIFSGRQKSGGYLQQKMFTIASALEGLHRGLNPGYEKKSPAERARNNAIIEAVHDTLPQHRNWLKDAIASAHRKTYSFRIQELLNKTDNLMSEVVGNEVEWTRQLTGIRNGIGHVLASQDKKTVEQVFAILQSAQLLAEMILLRELGFSTHECRRSFEHHWEINSARHHVKKGFPEWFTG